MIKPLELPASLHNHYGESVPLAQMDEIVGFIQVKMNATLCEYLKLICVPALKSCSAKLLLESIALRFEVERGLKTSRPESFQTLRKPKYVPDS